MFYPLNVGAEKLAAQEPVLGGEGPALPSRVGLVVKGQRHPQGVGFAPSAAAPACPLVPALSSHRSLLLLETVSYPESFQQAVLFS